MDPPVATTVAVAPSNPDVAAGIEVSSPATGDTIKSGFTVSGRSNTWDGNVYYRLVGGGDIELAAGKLTGGAGDWGPFSGEVVFENTCCTELQLELYELVDGGGRDLRVTVFLNAAEDS